MVLDRKLPVKSDEWNIRRTVSYRAPHPLPPIVNRPRLVVLCLIAAFVTRLLPREVVARVVGSESGLLGLLVAMMMGAVLPGGPLTIYPLAGAFLVLGADVGTAVAFITAWNLLGYNRALIWELPFFGPEFVGWRVLMALPLPIIGGLLARMAARLIVKRGGSDQWT